MEGNLKQMIEGSQCVIKTQLEMFLLAEFLLIVLTVCLHINQPLDNVQIFTFIVCFVDFIATRGVYKSHYRYNAADLLEGRFLFSDEFIS